jgi:hypothetical protein
MPLKKKRRECRELNYIYKYENYIHVMEIKAFEREHLFALGITHE